MHNIYQLKVWEEAIELAVEVYKATSSFPKEETYGLTSQIRRSAISISSNIAEGAGRNSNNEFNFFLGISNGSSHELQTQIIISNRLKLLSEKEANPLLMKISKIQKMSYKLQQSLVKKI